MTIENTEIYELVKKRLEKEFEVTERVGDRVWNDVEYDASGIILYERRPHFQRTDIITKSAIFKLKYHSENKDWNIF